MKKIIAAATAVVSCFLTGHKGNTAQTESPSFYSFTVNGIDGNELSLSAYKGKTLLVVNTASKCGFTKQYESLETLYTAYKGRSFEVLAFPANNFLNQEPDDNAQIKEFCTTKFNVSFPLFAKISVKGDDIHPLYRYLTSVPGFEGDISWNFNKFLIDSNGNVVARFGSRVDPLDSEIITQLEKILPPVNSPE
ncbi:glutathione peroxidase [bacterium]|nr:glutathione peroxidase [bacterium]